MLFVSINWLYVLLTTFCMGYAFSEISGRLFSYRLGHIDSILMAGLACAAVYAQVFSLFSGVGVLANGLLVIFSLAVLFAFRGRIWLDLKAAWNRTGILFKILVPALFLFWAFCTSFGYQLPDMALYHAQSIRWIEEYGIVPGQALLNSRFAYNSSVFSLAALYSLKFLAGQSMHAMSGWIAFLLSITAMDVINGRRKLRWSDFANAAAIYYLTTIWDEVIVPSSDYAAMCTSFFLVIKWVRQLEKPQEEQKIAPYALLCVLGVFSLTLKLTAGLILLLLMKPACQLLKKRKWREIALYLSLGLIVAVPWMIRSVLLSGWLIYPLPQLDLFQLPWKQQVEWIEFDIACIKTWGRGLYNSAMVDAPVWEWFGGWFQSVLEPLQKLIVLADIGAAILFVPFSLSALIRRTSHEPDRLLVLLTVVCSYLYWQLSAPLPRYGYAYMLLLPALMFGEIVLAVGKDQLIRAALACFGLYKLWMLIMHISSAYLMAFYVRQADYEAPPRDLVGTKMIGSVSFYHTEAASSGYEYFPSIGSPPGEIRLRGESLEDGFELANP